MSDKSLNSSANRFDDLIDVHGIQSGQIAFPFESNKSLHTQIQLHNKSSKNFIAYKFQNTNPKRYSVIPGYGSIAPGSEANIKITMRPYVKDTKIILNNLAKMLLKSLKCALDIVLFAQNLGENESLQVADKFQIIIAEMSDLQSDEDIFAGLSIRSDGNKRLGVILLQIQSSSIINHNLNLSDATRQQQPQSFQSEADLSKPKIIDLENSICLEGKVQQETQENNNQLESNQLVILSKLESLNLRLDGLEGNILDLKKLFREKKTETEQELKIKLRRVKQEKGKLEKKNQQENQEIQEQLKIKEKMNQETQQFKILEEIKKLQEEIQQVKEGQNKIVSIREKNKEEKQYKENQYFQYNQQIFNQENSISQNQIVLIQNQEKEMKEIIENSPRNKMEQEKLTLEETIVNINEELRTIRKMMTKQEGLETRESKKEGQLDIQFIQTIVAMIENSPYKKDIKNLEIYRKFPQQFVKDCYEANPKPIIIRKL